MAVLYLYTYMYSIRYCMSSGLYSPVKREGERERKRKRERKKVKKERTRPITKRGRKNLSITRQHCRHPFGLNCCCCYCCRTCVCCCVCRYKYSSIVQAILPRQRFIYMRPGIDLQCATFYIQTDIDSSICLLYIFFILFSFHVFPAFEIWVLFFGVSFYCT